MGYRLAEITQLARELEMAPLRHRLRHLAGAERLLTLLQADKEYPYAFVCFHVTGYRPRHESAASLSGGSLIADLAALIDELTNRHPMPASGAGEPLHSPEELARRFRVSARTIARWKLRGLIGRWFDQGDGRSRYAVPQSSLARFVSRNIELIRRAAQFQVMDGAERRRIIERAAVLLAEQPRSMHAVSKIIAGETGRAMETIRLLLQRYDTENPGDPLFGRESMAEISPETAIATAFREGESVESIAQRFDRSEDVVRGVIGRNRQAELARTPIEYIYSAEYDHPEAEQMIFANPADGPIEEALRERPSERVSAALPPYLQALYRVPLLTAAGERTLFHRYNLLRHQAEVIRRQLRPTSPSLDAIARIERLLDRAACIKSDIVQANLRLVISIAKRHVRSGRGRELFELVSDGNMALMRAVDKFDVSRGFKFSTYASWAIIRHFARAIPEEIRWEHRHQTGRDEVLALTGDRRAEPVREEEPQDLRRVLTAGLSRLDERERVIIERHFGLDPSKAGAPLEVIGRELGISKERARQIKERALEKLREAMAGVSAAVA